MHELTPTQRIQWIRDRFKAISRPRRTEIRRALRHAINITGSNSGPPIEEQVPFALVESMLQLADAVDRAATVNAAGVESSPVVEETADLAAHATFVMIPADVGAQALTLIAAERQRQVTEEGCTPEHDDSVHMDGALAKAAASYALAAHFREMGFADRYSVPEAWPWRLVWWKPSPDDRTRELVKAGALIVAEIERLQRAHARAHGGAS